MLEEAEVAEERRDEVFNAFDIDEMSVDGIVLVFIQTGSNAANGLITAIGILAIFLAFIILFIFLGLLVLRLAGE